MLKHAAKFIMEAANAVQNLQALVDALKGLKDHIPSLPPDLWSWSQGAAMDPWSWIERLWQLT